MTWSMRMRLAAAAIAWIGLASSAVAQPPPVEALPEILSLQIEQHPAWRAYKDAVAEQRADAAAEAQQVEQINALATPARLDALRDQLRARDQAFERQAAATRAFYAELSPEQRQVFDRVTAVPRAPAFQRRPPPRSSYRVPTDANGEPALPPPQ